MIANLIIGGLIVCGAVLALRFMIRRPKGKGCCGSCSGCSGCMAGKTEKKIWNPGRKKGIMKPEAESFASGSF